jgi:DNA-binding NarL/FixJ family response regulator
MFALGIARRLEVVIALVRFDSVNRHRQRVHPQLRQEVACAREDRQREVLELMAEGLSNSAIGARVFLSDRGVEKHVTSIFQKLGLPVAADTHRRVLAVVAFLRS